MSSAARRSRILDKKFKPKPSTLKRTKSNDPPPVRRTKKNKVEPTFSTPQEIAQRQMEARVKTTAPQHPLRFLHSFPSIGSRFAKDVCGRLIEFQMSESMKRLEEKRALQEYTRRMNCVLFQRSMHPSYTGPAHICTESC
jgi:hypothetical protein